MRKSHCCVKLTMSRFPWPDDAEIHSASKNRIKYKAVKEWLRKAGKSNKLVVFTPGETGCPQPCGPQSAFMCIHARLANKKPERGIVLFAIENFIRQRTVDGRWVDSVLIVVRYIDENGEQHETYVRSPSTVFVPKEFEPTEEPDIAEPLGYSVTVGEKIAEAYPEIDPQDWFNSIDKFSPTRQEQIASGLDVLKDLLWQ